MKSEKIDQLMLALSKAQGEMKHALKESVNGYLKSKYADLPTVIDACRSCLSKYQLAVAQTIERDEFGMKLVTILGHSSGQWMSSSMPILSKDDTPQGVGSAITYARRYSLAALVGVAQYDDDAEAAMARTAKQEKRQPISPKDQITTDDVESVLGKTVKQEKTYTVISKDQFKALEEMFKKLDKNDKEKFLNFMEVSSLNEVPIEKFKKSYSILEKKYMQMENMNVS